MPPAVAVRPTSPQQPTFKSVLGRGSALPNLYWTALPQAQLRTYHSNYVGLPADCIVTEPITHRYVRQQTPLWQALHAGRLTTGRLNAALGFQEPGAARAVGAHQAAGAIVYAYDHLMQPTWEPPAGADTDTDRVLALNEQARNSLYEGKLPESSLPVEGMWDGSHPGSGEVLKRQVCEQVGLQGVVACRLHWGNVQEPAALHALGQIFPNSVLEEVGMLCVDPLALPSSWGCAPSEIPALGASPDALIRHALPITHAQLEHARHELRSAATFLSTSPAPTPLYPPSASTAESVAPGPPTTTPSLTHRPTISRDVINPPSPRAASPCINHAPPSAQDLHQNAVTIAGGLLLSALSALPLGPVDPPALEASMVLTQEVQQSGQVLARPPVRHHAVLQLTSTNEESVELLASILLDPNMGLQIGQRKQQHLPNANGGSDGGSSNGSGSSRGGSGNVHIKSRSTSQLMTEAGCVDEEGTVWLPWREVVEVKNHSPFTLKDHRKARHGNIMLQYALTESGPLDQLRASWLPQLQWHCLAAGTSSGLLVSRTPSKGVSVFRVHRDDDFLMLALRLVRHVHVGHSGRGILPPIDIMQSPEYRPEHQAAIMATRQLASASKVLVTRGGHHQGGAQHVRMGPGCDNNPLWNVTKK